VKMSRLRQTIAGRLKTAQNNAAMLTTYNEVDLTAVMELRKLYKDKFEKEQGVKLGFMSFFAKAVIEGLKEWPALNAEIDSDEIVYKNYYNLSVAVSTEKGLVVPVLKDADKMSFAEIEQGIRDFAMKARDGKLTPDDMTGGTYTITNGGTFGSMMSMPILNYPQVGILGMHNIVQRPVVVDGEIVIRPMMYLAMTYDHRIVDGREAVSFVVKIKECLENPSRMLLGV
jgi:2-oxoglutarate dehydrogenase E2 component (dihydrolipoamide succinyltransferase)